MLASIPQNGALCSRRLWHSLHTALEMVCTGAYFYWIVWQVGYWNADIDSSRAVWVSSTHRAADDVVLVRVPTDVPHARVMARQSGDHSTCQHIINYEDTQINTSHWSHPFNCCHTRQNCTDASLSLKRDFGKIRRLHVADRNMRMAATHWRFCQWSSQSR